VQNAANSGVGRAVIQLAGMLGLRTLNVVRREELIPELKAIGADVVVCEEADLREQAMSLCGGVRPKLGLNAIGGASALNVANALEDEAPLITYGAMGHQPLKIPNGLLIFKNLSFHGFWLRRWRQRVRPQEIRDTYATLAGFLQRGVLHTPIHKIFTLCEVDQAVLEAQTDKRSGKVLLDLSL
jgi:trans-2-enoyl-CoA reductase